MEKETNLQSLKSNPIFQLSLASKELFHSNFLYWLSQDDNLRPYFEYVIDSLCGEDNKINWKETFGGDGPGKYNYVVLREYKNFDLCICKKKSTQTNNSSSAVGNGKGDNNNSTDEYQSKMGVDADGDEYEDNNSSNEDPTEASDPNYDEIQQAGEIVFVLENKFKSIATKAQLDKYEKKVTESNDKIYRDSFLSNNSQYKDLRNKGAKNAFQNYKDNNPVSPIFVLLTLAQKFGEREAIKNDGKWIIRNYEEYAQFLINSLLDINDGKLSSFNVSYQIIWNYIGFIRTFSLEINKRLDDIKLTDNWNSIFEEKNKEYKSIRCSDIWQKMAMHKIAQELMGKDEIKKLTSQGFVIDTDSSDKHCRECKDYNIIFIGVQFFHSLALLEIKYRINDDCMFVIQQQGNSLCAGIDYLTKKPGLPGKDFWPTKIVNGNITIGVKTHAYKNEKGVFYYKKIILKPTWNSKDNGNSTIEETLKFMVECLMNAIKILLLWGIVESLLLKGYNIQSSMRIK